MPAPFAAPRCRQHLRGKKTPHVNMAQCVSQGSPELSIREENDVETTNRHLMWHGMFLFLLGLATGLVEQRFANVRMGLAAHLEGVMNGMLLVGLGAIWTEVKLPPRAKATAYWTALYGTYVNWLVTTLAAVFGTAALSPISSAGHSGKPWQEILVTAGFQSVSVVIVASALLVLWGLRRGALPPKLDASRTAEGQRG